MRTPACCRRRSRPAPRPPGAGQAALLAAVRPHRPQLGAVGGAAVVEQRAAVAEPDEAADALARRRASARRPAPRVPSRSPTVDPDRAPPARTRRRSGRRATSYRTAGPERPRRARRRPRAICAAPSPPANATWRPSGVNATQYGVPFPPLIDDVRRRPGGRAAPARARRAASARACCRRATRRARPRSATVERAPVRAQHRRCAARPATARRPSADQSAPRPGTLEAHVAAQIGDRDVRAIGADAREQLPVGRQRGRRAARGGQRAAPGPSERRDRVLRERARSSRAPGTGSSSRVPSAENTGGAGGESAPAAPPTTTLRSAPPSGEIISRQGPARLLQNANARPFGDVASATSAYGLRETLRRAAPGAMRVDLAGIRGRAVAREDDLAGRLARRAGRRRSARRARAPRPARPRAATSGGGSWLRQRHEPRRHDPDLLGRGSAVAALEVASAAMRLIVASEALSAAWPRRP